MMQLRRKIQSAVLALALLGGTAVAVTTAQDAQAATVYGICTGSTCAREASGAFEAWARDISGDSAQQQQRTYVGQVSSSNCWPFTCGNGFNAAYNGASVWRVYNIHTGHCMAADDGYYVYATACNANGVNWVWDGTTASAHLVNVYQTDLHDSGRILTTLGNGFQLEATGGGNQLWGLILGS